MATRRGQMLAVERKGLIDVLQTVGGLETKVARNAVRKGFRLATARTTKKLKSAMPSGRTGLLNRSIAGKTRFDLKRFIAFGVSGQRTDKSRNRSNTNKNTSKQSSKASSIRGRISGGLTGRGLAPSLHLVDQNVAPHDIAAKNAPRLWWRIAKGGVHFVPWASDTAVKHPGHSKGRGIVPRVERQTQATSLRIVRRHVEQAVKEAVT